MSESEPNTTLLDTVRITVAMARAGCCSRRQADSYIAQGRVTVNGATVSVPYMRVSGSDTIALDGEVIGDNSPTQLWRFHKRSGTITTHHDPRGRATVFGSLPAELPRVVAIGRLDFNSEGLLLLTNDGALAGHLASPQLGWKRRYRVRAYGNPRRDMIAQLGRGVEVDGVEYAPIVVEESAKGGSNRWYDVTIAEGKNREIRRTFAAFGLEVNRLIRVSFGPFQLGALAAGQVASVPAKVLKEQLGGRWAVRN